MSDILDAADITPPRIGGREARDRARRPAIRPHERRGGRAAPVNGPVTVPSSGETFLSAGIFDLRGTYFVFREDFSIFLCRARADRGDAAARETRSTTSGPADDGARLRLLRLTVGERNGNWLL